MSGVFDFVFFPDVSRRMVTLSLVLGSLFSCMFLVFGSLGNKILVIGSYQVVAR